MAQNLSIHAITPEISDWTSKIQIVDISRPGESTEKKIKYLNMIIQDEQENQAKAIVYGDDIPSYQDLLKLYHTYYITGARIQVPNLKYEIPLHAFQWILDKKTIIDPVEQGAADALPPPTKLSVASFQHIKDQVIQATNNLAKKNFDILAVVVNCSQPRYVESVKKRLQELIVMDTFQHTLTFTIWEEAIIEDEGKKLLQHFPEHPIILARRIGASKYNGVSLTTKFSTTIQIDPPYPQFQQLQAWVTENKPMLTSSTLESTSKSGFVIPIPMDEEVVPIATINSQQERHTFSIEAKMSFPNDIKSLYVLGCIKCGQEVRLSTIREIYCLNCCKKRMLVPRCRFEVNLEDSSGSTVGLITGKEGEKLLSLTTKEIYETASIQDIERNFNHKFFKVRAKKLFTHTSKVTSAKLYIQSCVEKQSITYSLPISTTTGTGEGSERKHKLEPHQLTEQSESLKMKQKLEPPTPTKMN